MKVELTEKHLINACPSQTDDAAAAAAAALTPGLKALSLAQDKVLCAVL